ncbi:MAG TPA: ABC transporter substrate-binding protein [Aggregatilineales bacterium]|nr:ABC transporter substrate-binding protein [Aggregatilineales bacterium]
MKRYGILLLVVILVSLVARTPVAAQGNGSIAVYANPTTLPSLDPSTSFSNDNTVMGNAYETLTFYNVPGSAKEIGPKLATSWEASADTLTWTFKLRQGVKFHDGTDFKADAVKYSVERTKKLGQGASYIFDPVDTITVVDDYTVQFKLKYSAPLDLIMATGYAAWMISPKVGDKTSDWFNAGNDDGTGPYKIESYDVGQRLVTTRFDDYWGGWKPGQFQKVVFQIAEDPTVRQQLITSGGADFTYDLAWDNYPSLQTTKGVKVLSNPSFQNLLALLNHAKSPTDNVKVRQALAYSFPYDKVVKSLYGGLGTQARGPVPAKLWGHDPQTKQYQQDLDKAKQLLTEAGYPNGGLTLKYTYVSGDLNEQQVGELWKADLAKLGVTLDIQGMAWEAQWDLGKTNPAKAQEIFLFYWWPDYVTPYSFLYAMFHSEDKPNFNLGYYYNSDFDKLIEQGNQASGTDKAKAGQLFGKAQQMLADDAAAIFIVDLPNVHVIRDNISGFVDNPAYSHIVFWYDLTRGG